MVLTLLIIALGVAALAYAAALGMAVVKTRQWVPKAEGLVLGAVTNFFDTLGIGSFAPTMAWLNFRRLVPLPLMPVTMVAGYILPAIAQAMIFLILLGVQVDPLLLVGCSAAMVVGGIAGVPIATRSPVRAVQAIVGLALLVAALFHVLALLALMPAGGMATSLSPPLMLLVVAVHFGLGVLLNFGVGNYAPTLALLSLLGMDPRLAFPIMASSAAFSGSAAAARIIRVRELDLRLVLGLALGAIPAVLIAAFVVRDMPVTMLKWLVVAVLVIAGVNLLLAAARRPPAPAPDALVGRAIID